MKKIKVVFVLIIMLMSSFMFVNKSSAVTISTSDTPKSVKSEEEFTITIKFDKKVKTFSAYLVYEPDLFTISEKSENKNLKISKYSDNVIALLFTAQNDTEAQDSFKINAKSNKVTEDKKAEFKLTRIAMDTGNEADEKSLNDINFSIDINAIKEKPVEKPITDQDDIGTKQENKDNTLSNKILAKTGEGTLLLSVIAALIALAIIFKVKSNKLKKLFVMLPILVAVSTIGVTTSEAVVTGEGAEDKVRAETLNNNMIGVSANKEFYFNPEDQKQDRLYKEDLSTFLAAMSISNPTITINNSERQSLSEPYLGTGDNINTYTMVLYGDIDENGTICDANDMEKIIKHIIKETQLTAGSANYVAADVDLNNAIDIFDLERMRNKLLGYDGHSDKADKLGGTLIKVKQDSPDPDTTEARMSSQISKRTLTKGEEATIRVTISPLELANQGVNFEVTPSNLVTINNISSADSNGVITATVTANSSTSGDGKIKITSKGQTDLINTLDVSVTDKLAQFTFYISPATIEVGGTATITATKTPETADGIGEPRYRSQNTSVATVDEITGVVTGVGTGTTNIIATSTENSNMNASLSITVIGKQFTEISWNQKPTSVRVGETVQPSITITPSDAVAPTITWSSSDANVATINATTGLITGVSAGTTDITVRAQAGSGAWKSLTYSITVTE